MSTSIPISQLDPDTLIHNEDFIAIVDSGSLTTFRASMKTLNDYFATSGSILSASFTSQSISTSYAVNADTASYLFPRLYLMTASFALNVPPTTVVQSASLAKNAQTASRLEGIGSSFANSLIINNSLSATGSAYIAIQARKNITSSINIGSIKSDSLFFNKDYSSGINGYSKAFFSDNNFTNLGKFVFEIGDTFTNVNSIGPDIDGIVLRSKGILFEINEAGNLDAQTRTGSLAFISGSGRTYLRIAEAQEFSSSVIGNGGIGFFGTASYALQASFSLATTQNLPVGSVVAYASTGSIPNWLLSDGSTFDNIGLPILASEVSNSFGKPLNLNTVSSPTAHSFTINFLSGGSGIFQVYINSVTHSVNLQTSYSLSIPSLSPGLYPYAIIDNGFNPDAEYDLTAIVAASGPVTSSTFTVGTSAYRLPSVNQYFVIGLALNPLDWIIHAG